MSAQSEIQSLSEADLLAAAGPIALKQARADLAGGMLATYGSGEPVTVIWPDATCSFPSGGLPAATCTCPARRTCRHRARSVLWLQAHGTPEPSAAPIEAPEAAFLNLEQVRSEAGAALFNKASRALAEGLEVGPAEEPGAWIVLGNRVRLVPGATLAAAICACGSRDLCLHRVLAGLVQAGGVIDEYFDIELFDLDQIENEAAALLSLGLDGCPIERAERLEHLAQQLLLGLPAAADDLEALAALLRRYHQRSARFSSSDWSLVLGRLLARLAALPVERSPAEARALRGVTRRAPLPAPPLDLQHLGAEVFVGPDSTLLRLWFCEHPSGKLRHVSLGRPATELGPLDPEILWKILPLWGMERAADLAGRRIRLLRGRLSPDGALSAGGDASALVQGDALADALPPTLVVSSITTLQEGFLATLPVILRSRDQGSALLALALADPPSPAVARFDEARQTLHATVVLASGDTLDVQVRATPFADRLLSALSLLGRWHARPTHLLARCWPGERGWACAPISAWLEGGAGPISLGLSPGVCDAAQVPLTAGDLPTIEADPGREALTHTLDLLEGLAIEGRVHGARAPRFLQAAERLERLHLRTGAAHLRGLAAALQAGDERGLARSWSGALAWALQVEERLRISP